jgi:hypothetical protein
MIQDSFGDLLNALTYTIPVYDLSKKSELKDACILNKMIIRQYFELEELSEDEKALLRKEIKEAQSQSLRKIFMKRLKVKNLVRMEKKLE